jgi:thioredoxin-related protein
MKNMVTVVFLLLGALVTSAQSSRPVPAADASGKGIKFVQGLSWDQIKAKAKAENKYIFIDSYATWCGPCKAMDKNVYASEKVGDYFNEKFVSAKVQFDKTEEDSEEVKKWYADAEALEKQYKVGGFPTYLFFSPEGEIVHRDTGERKIAEFINLASEALDPSKQFYTLLKNYQQGQKDYAVMPYLAKTASMLADRDTANAIVADYKDNYFNKLSDDEICTKDMLWFVNQFADQFLYPEGSKGKLFSLLYHHADQVDKAAERKGFSDTMVSSVIRREEIENKVWKDDKPLTTKPDWEKIRANVRNKYKSAYADSLVPAAQLRFYKRTGDWREFARLRDQNIREHPPAAGKELFAPDGTWMLNVDAWDVFQHCNDKIILAKALKWADLAIKLDETSPNPQVLDTRANLLYKLGRVKEAIRQERKAIQLDNAMAKKNGQQKGGFVAEYSATIVKMKRRDQTWP